MGGEWMGGGFEGGVGVEELGVVIWVWVTC